MKTPQVAGNWNAALYDSKHAFIFEYGKDVLGLLAPQPHERILDLGCGTGHLTAAIAQAGADVVGVDAAPSMIEKAQQEYPALTFYVDDARTARFDAHFDAVFSNAALHWIHDAEAVVETIALALRSGGRFVAEFGARGNVAKLMSGVARALRAHGISASELENRWYFPTLGEYSALLERHDFEVLFAQVFDRPTALDDGDRGLRNWLTLFAPSVMQLPPAQREPALAQAEESLRPELFRDGTWYADYRRLRVIARKR